ncbi:hypothetical protein EAI35_18955 [Enterobacter bugandensis]|nr:hypothetical protein EAI35_18955 [Enterobacter bugandensis]
MGLLVILLFPMDGGFFLGTDIMPPMGLSILLLKERPWFMTVKLIQRRECAYMKMPKASLRYIMEEI